MRIVHRAPEIRCFSDPGAELIGTSLRYYKNLP